MSATFLTHFDSVSDPRIECCKKHNQMDVLLLAISAAVKYESAVDRIGSEYHELIGRAKNIGSAAVFVSLCLVTFICFMVVVL